MQINNSFGVTFQIKLHDNSLHPEIKGCRVHSLGSWQSFIFFPDGIIFRMSAEEIARHLSVVAGLALWRFDRYQQRKLSYP